MLPRLGFEPSILTSKQRSINHNKPLGVVLQFYLFNQRHVFRLVHRHFV